MTVHIKLFTIKNLTFFDLSIGYFTHPDDLNDNAFIAEGVARALCIQNMLSQCPNLEVRTRPL